MPARPTPSRLAPALAVVLALLAACRPEPRPPAPPRPSVATPQVQPSTDLRGASDEPQAAPAIGALTAGQAGRGALGQPMQPSGGDGTPAAASVPASSAARR